MHGNQGNIPDVPTPVPIFPSEFDRLGFEDYRTDGRTV
jgi:hypothetical protein